MLNYKHIDKTLAFEVNHKHSAEWAKSIWRKMIITNTVMEICGVVA